MALAGQEALLLDWIGIDLSLEIDVLSFLISLVLGKENIRTTKKLNTCVWDRRGL